MNPLWAAIGVILLLTMTALVAAGVRSLVVGGGAIALVRRSASCGRRVWATCLSRRLANEADAEAELEIRTHVDALLQERAVRQGRVVVALAATFFILRVPDLVARLLTQESDVMPADAVPVVVTIAFAASAVGTIVPATINRRTLMWWHFLFMVVISVIQSPLGGDARTVFVLRRATTLAQSIAVGFLCVRMRVLAVSYAFLSFCLISVYLTSSEAAEMMTFRDLLVSELTVYVVKLCLFKVFESTLRFGAEQEVQSKLGQCHRSAVSALLGMVCDAVVDTDSELRLKMHEDSLANLLMLGQGKSLKGAPLMNCVASDADNQERFRAGIAGNVQADDGPRAGMFTGRLRDALGNSIAIMVYHVPYFTISSQVHHLIGFREDSDSSVAKEPGFPDATLAHTVAERLGSQGVASMSPSSNSSGRSGTSSRASSRASSVPGSHSLTVDVVVAEGLPIRGASHNFKESFCQQGHICGFTDLVQGDGERLAAWIRENADLVRSGAVAAPRVETFGAIEMRTGAAGAAIRRRLVICFPPLPADAGEEYCVSIKLGRDRDRRSAAAPLGRGTSATGVQLELGPFRSGDEAREHGEALSTLRL